eukprot:CAMPEP_0170377156 /NCGR_PEP_ID=MMETSP0117_2-20130122/12118_1 /TAXON_ID=400756 /ORGANISM="Durinskia baltica, Strain CSIRO CS-38" /LENGTH=88 /DNA_ID=CAMNT_0010632427 /DNA_START=265 /DNA_END=527 /DNA_ORIENTATION=+
MSVAKQTHGSGLSKYCACFAHSAQAPSKVGSGWPGPLGSRWPDLTFKPKADEAKAKMAPARRYCIAPEGMLYMRVAAQVSNTRSVNQG